MFRTTVQNDQKRNSWNDNRFESTLQQLQDIYQNLKQIFDNRILQYEATIKTVCDRLQNDELLDTLKKDKTSVEFVQIRIKEIIQECLIDEKESVIEKMSMQLSKIKSDYQLIDDAYIQLQGQQDDLKIKYTQDIQSYQNKVLSLQSELDRQRKQIDIINQSSSSKMKNQELIIENKTSIINELQRQIIENQSNHKANSDNINFMRNSQQIVDLQQNILKDQEMQNIKSQLSELQLKLNQQIQAFSAQEEEMFESKKINRQLQEENKKLTLQAQQISNTSSQIETRYKKDLEITKNSLQLQLQELSEKFKQKTQKYKTKNSSLKKNLEEYKQKIQEIYDESQIQNEQFKNDKRILVEQIEILKTQYEYEIQLKQTEVANTIQASNANFVII